MAIVKETKCPKCGGELLIDDYDDYEMESEISIELQVYGHCEKCDTDYKWTEVHKYVGIKDLKEAE